MKTKLRVWNKAEKEQLMDRWGNTTLDGLFTLFGNKPRTSILHEIYDIMSGGKHLPTNRNDQTVSKIRQKLLDDGMGATTVTKSMLWFYND